MAEIAQPAVLYRRLWPADHGALRRHLLRLGEEDRRLRFGGVATDGHIRRYAAQLDWRRAMVVGAEIDGVLRAACELKILTATAEPAAEVALTVEQAYQERGIGTRLFRRATTLAVNRGIRRLYVLCWAQNRRMHRIVLRYDAKLAAYEQELEGQIHLPWPSQATLAQEFLDELQATLRTSLRPWWAGAAGA